MAKAKLKLNIHDGVINDVYLPFFEKSRDSRFLILYGGAGSGKSVAIAQHIILKMLTTRNFNVLVCRKFASSLRNSVFANLESIINALGLSEYFHTIKNPLEITCLLNENKIIFAGLTDVNRLKSVSDISLAWVEEADETDERDITQLSLRLRGGENKKQIIVSFNPTSAEHWLNKRFFIEDPEIGVPTVGKNCLILRTTYLNNAYLDNDYIEEMERLKEVDYEYYEIYALGKWGTLQNVIFRNYIVKEIDLQDEDFDEIYYGLDFGFNNPNAMVKIGVLDSTIYVLDEFKQSNQTAEQLIESLKEKEVKLNKTIYADSAYPAYIHSINNANFYCIGVNKKKRTVSEELNLIKNFDIVIGPNCVAFKKEITFYKYKMDKNGNLKEEPVKVEDHLMDAFRYSLQEFLDNYTLGLDNKPIVPIRKRPRSL